MYHIDLSLTKCVQENGCAEHSNENHNANNLFESIIIRNIQDKHNNISGCFACSSCVSHTNPVDKRKIIEINCNGLLNCDYCEINDKCETELFPDDFIIVQLDESLEVAQVKLIGEIVRLKRQSIGFYGENLPLVIRKASVEDLDRVRKNLHDEEKAVKIFRDAINKLNLSMKLVSIHYQFDRKKLFFFYTSESRVDFRELAKGLAAEFKTRIELRQIGVRDEAKKLGGMGTCGREFCCISFLAGFRRITTHLANEQNLLSSMGKLSGPCGKLKCCLSFEVE
ncbi:MAG: regulatory iron-sulfur-containing complex subunit RicT [Ignavibacteriales bacterium]|nr:regulatory iron-sulfur-containing complex subunit RicT [Ignavibacteriales bacterium]